MPADDWEFKLLTVALLESLEGPVPLDLLREEYLEPMIAGEEASPIAIEAVRQAFATAAASPGPP